MPSHREIDMFRLFAQSFIEGFASEFGSPKDIGHAVRQGYAEGQREFWAPLVNLRRRIVQTWRLESRGTADHKHA